MSHTVYRSLCIIYENILSLGVFYQFVTQFIILPNNQLINSAIQRYLYRWYNPEKIELFQINIYIFSFNAAPIQHDTRKTNLLTSQSCKPLPYDCTSVWASRYYFQHVFCTCEFNEQRWKHQNTKMYKGPSWSIVRIPQNFFIYYTSDWNFLVSWTKLLKTPMPSQYKRTNMYVFSYVHL